MNTRKMWLFYTLAWLAYAILISLALLADQKPLSEQIFWFGRNLFFVVPAPLALALLWPLSRYLNQARFSGLAKVAVHVVGALLFTLFI